jgi:hypothetical protein
MPEDPCGADRLCSWRQAKRFGFQLCIALDDDGDPCRRKAMRWVTQRALADGEQTTLGQPFCEYHADELAAFFSRKVVRVEAFKDAKAEHKQAEAARLAAEEERLRQLEARKVAKRTVGRQPDMLYFAKRGERIKIGHSTAPTKRLTDLANSAGAPFDAVVITTGGVRKEQAYHQRFAADRLHGEWFSFTDVIAREMAKLSNDERAETYENWPKPAKF